jgi:hypothetical protein
MAVTLIDTGDATQTGGRLRRVRAHLDKEEASVSPMATASAT